ncbi:hypothetical protein OHS33_09770 [Streptomyces sp. NBC_00536]|uniref:hypothetical protein n=1 Tax=Streptomyces sp. NBC_00536 TaxID=2975769 RepID=UPI002E804E4C|nr:hypothetical protein [Streptomyces sp. NBC_00536]WUC78600.1 hypothetical protein OHS33_09770 [Streptomyces sp. NBC_00536]
MGMTVLYIAFGFVALWLLAEVLLQYKARLRWRLLAFTGFVGVVVGVVLPSVLVIAAGAAAFAVGQALVTLSFRKGFVAGWALRRGGAPVRTASKRRRGAGGAQREPALRVSGLEYGSEDAAEAAAGPHGGADTATDHDQVGGAQRDPAGPAADEMAPYGSEQAQPTQAFASPFGAAEQDGHQYAAYYDPQFPQAQPQGDGYDYHTGYAVPGEQQVYAAYSDPYIGTGGTAQPASYGDYAAYADPYAAQHQAAQQQYSMDTPPGGVWVPQQRYTDQDAQQPPQQPQPQPGDPANPQQPYPYPYQGTGDYEPYRY